MPRGRKDVLFWWNGCGESLIILLYKVHMGNLWEKGTHMKFKMRNAAVLLVFLILMLALPAVSEQAHSPEQIPADMVQNGDVLCFGEPDDGSGFDGKWLVLDSAYTNTGEEGMFLVSLNLIGGESGESVLFRQLDGDPSVSFSDRGEAYAAKHPGATDYRGSDIQAWCGSFLKTHFTEAEQNALLPVYHSDEAIVIPGFTIPLPGAANGTVDFDPAENVLDGDRLFLLSVEEITSEAYGFTDACSRVALYKGETAGYWLRSPHIPTFPLDVGFVFPFGAVMDYPVNAKSMYEMTSYARPACNLDRNAVADLELLSEKEGVRIFRVTMKGDRANTREYDTSLPAVGKVMDLGRVFLFAAIAIIIVLFALIGFMVWLIVRGVRKRRKARAA